MRVSENLSILFLTEKTALSRKDGRAPIYARITLNGQRSEISLGMRINPEVWDQENGRIKGVSHENLLMNSQITQAKANLEKHFFLLTTQFDYVIG
jgi:Arm DNA-binding domain